MKDLPLVWYSALSQPCALLKRDERQNENLKQLNTPQKQTKKPANKELQQQPKPKPNQNNNKTTNKQKQQKRRQKEKKKEKTFLQVNSVLGQT